METGFWENLPIIKVFRAIGRVFRKTSSVYPQNLLNKYTLNRLVENVIVQVHLIQVVL